FAILGMAKRANGIDGNAVGGGLEPHDAIELCRGANAVGGEIDAPHADACGLLGQRQRLAVERIAGEEPCGFGGRALLLRPRTVISRACRSGHVYAILTDQDGLLAYY